MSEAWTVPIVHRQRLHGRLSGLSLRPERHRQDRTMMTIHRTLISTPRIPLVRHLHHPRGRLPGPAATDDHLIVNQQLLHLHVHRHDLARHHNRPEAAWSSDDSTTGRNWRRKGKQKVRAQKGRKGSSHLDLMKKILNAILDPTSGLARQTSRFSQYPIDSTLTTVTTTTNLQDYKTNPKTRRSTIATTTQTTILTKQEMIQRIRI